MVVKVTQTSLKIFISANRTVVENYVMKKDEFDLSHANGQAFAPNAEVKNEWK